jgi:hypothetical protein
MIETTKIITKKNIKTCINKILSKKNYTNKDFRFLELYIQIYLLLSKKRKLAQIYIHTKYNKPISLLQNIKQFLDKNYPFYIIDMEDYGGNNKMNRIVLYQKNYNINKLNKSYSKKYAKDLGDFYVCAGNFNKIIKKYKNLLRPVIKIDYMNKYNNKISFELYAQVCPIHILSKNINKLVKIKNNIKKIIQKINPKLFTYLIIQPF